MHPSAPSPLPHGRHVLAELTGCPAALLNDAAALENCLRECAIAGGATVVSSHFHRFAPQGVSGVIVIAESHITIHTWPEHGYAAIDVFTCGCADIAEAVMQQIVGRMGAGAVHRVSFERGPHAVPHRLDSPHAMATA